MADKKISALPAVVTPVGTDEFPVNQGGTTKKMTRAQVHALESGEHLILPLVNEPLTPTLAFGDGDSGFFQPLDDNLQLSLVGTARFFWELDVYNAVAGTGPAMKNLAAGATVAGFVPRRSDPDTGIGSAGGDILSFVAGAIEIAQAKEVVGANQFIVAPGVIQNDGATPSLAFGDGDTGFFESLDDGLNVTTAGVTRFVWFGLNFQGKAGGGPAMVNVDSTATVPNLIPDSGDTDTGIGAAIADQLSLIAGGVQVANLTEAAGVVQLIVPLQNNAAAPSIAFGDGDTGFYEGSDDNLFVAFTGIETWKWTALEFKGSGATGVPSMINEVSSATNPVWSFQADPDTGVGRAGADILSLTAGGVEIAQAKEVVGANQFIIAPGVIQNAQLTPSLAFGDGDTGFFESLDDGLNVSMAGIARFVWFGDSYQGKIGDGPAMRNVAATSTVPNLHARSGDTDTGLGSAVANQLNLIAGGLTCMSISESAAARQIGFYESSPISLQTGVAVTTSAVHAALVALGLITA